MVSPEPGHGRVTRGQGCLTRALVAASIGLASGIFSFTTAAAFASSWAVALAVASLAAGLVAWLAWGRLIFAIDVSAASRPLKIVSAVATIVALVRLARLAVFIVAPSQTGYSTVPSSQWEIRHAPRQAAPTW